MTWNEAFLNSSNPVELTQNVSNTVPNFMPLVLFAVFMILGLFNYQRNKRYSFEKSDLLESFFVSSFITSILSVLLLIIELISVQYVYISMSITILIMIIIFFKPNE